MRKFAKGIKWSSKDSCSMKDAGDAPHFYFKTQAMNKKLVL